MRILTILMLLHVTGTVLAVDKVDNEKKKKIKWKDVIVAEKEPTGCESLGNIDQGKSSFFAFTVKQVKGRVEKGLKKQAAKLGGNTIFITEKVFIDGGAAYEAKAYYCQEQQAG